MVLRGEIEKILKNLKSSDNDILYGCSGYYSFIEKKIEVALNDIISKIQTHKRREG